MTQQHPPIAVTGLAKSYGDVHALKQLDLRVEPGEVTTILGPNGAGKTTAVNLMCGVLQPDGGRVELFGMDPRKAEARRRFGVMMQISGVPATLKVREHIDLFRRYYPNSMSVAEVLELSDLTDLAERRYGKLSGGQQRRLQFALAICGNPDLMFLDEPTVGLDVESRRTMWGHIQTMTQKGMAVILTTHYLEEAEALSDRILVMDQGQVIADGSPNQIKAMGRRKTIRCRTDLNRPQLTALPGVTQVRSLRDTQVELLTTSGDDTLRALIQQDADAHDIEVSGARLEDAFLHLTHNDQEHAA